MSAPPNFNRLARLYRWMELLSFGPWLWWCRCAFLGELAKCRRALVIGDGDGRFTARLLRANPNIQIDAVDSSAAMLQSLLRRAGPNVSRVRTYCTDARQFQSANPPYDLIVTHFFLDCLTTEEIESLTATLRKTTSPQTLWLVSEFAVPVGWFGRLVARPLVWCLYWTFGCLTGLTLRTLPDHRAALRQSGFTIQKRRTWLAGLLVSELWSISQSAKNQRP
ncbi:MAG TPA: class I SAM-dependent methyltransferase [Terracidiphilus sp.]|nr:class I SAM-dependent methyltransferase [Terracidiphilus sp.]